MGGTRLSRGAEQRSLSHGFLGKEVALRIILGFWGGETAISHPESWGNWDRKGGLAHESFEKEVIGV
jgi:hypothetical protein